LWYFAVDVVVEFAVHLSLLVCASVLLAFSSEISLAQGDDPGLRVRTVKILPADEDGTYAYGGSGFGLFQDIQVPVNEIDEVRGDGSFIGAENQTHFGLPLFAGLGYRSYSGSVIYDLAALEGTHMRAAAGNSETPSASYTRIELSSAARYYFGPNRTGLWLGMRAGIRRSFFNNISDSHFVESGILRASAGLQAGSMAITGFFGYAPASRVGYTAEGFTGGAFFETAKAQVTEAGLTSSFKISPQAFFDLGLEQEAIRLQINDIMEYNGLGLTVTPANQNNRDYNLSTMMMKVGIRKLF
jgi:hypothetical protein